MLLYIDPGTGSMLFSVLIGIVTTLWFVAKKAYIKIKYSLGTNVIKNDKSSDIVVFSDSKRYMNVFLPILNELDKRNVKVTYMTFDDDDPILSTDFSSISKQCIGYGNKAFATLNTVSCKVLLSTTPSLDVYQWKRSSDVNKYVHIFHYIGSATEYRMFGLAFYDAVLLNAKFQIDEIRQLEKIQKSKEKELVVVGSTYMDVLKQRYEDRKNNYSLNSKKYVLVAPTWGKNGLLSVYGSDLIDSILNTDYNVIIRPHPQSLTSDKKLIDGIVNRYINNERVSFNYDIDNFDVLHKASIMISDYSGVIFDYSLIFDRPVIYATSEINYDRDDSWFLKEEPYKYKALREFGAELKREDLKDIGKLITDTINSKQMKSKRAEIKNILWENVGDSALAVCDYLVKEVNR